MAVRSSDFSWSISAGQNPIPQMCLWWIFTRFRIALFFLSGTGYQSLPTDVVYAPQGWRKLWCSCETCCPYDWCGKSLNLND